jgi:hypothetical protein
MIQYMIQCMAFASGLLSMFKIAWYIYEAVFRAEKTVPHPREDPEPRDQGNGSKVHGKTDITLGRQFGATAVEDWSGWEVDEKLPFATLEHADSASRWQCEELQWPAERAKNCPPWSRIPFTQVMMLAGRITLMYQVCMLTMSNFAVANRYPEGCESWVVDCLQHEVKQPMGSPRKTADVFQSSMLSEFTPEFMSHPSPYVFIAASMTWTFLEWAHYRSNLEHRYQLAILGLAVILGLIPAIGSTAQMVPVLFCTMPWAIDLGLLVSDIGHNVKYHQHAFALRVQAS